MKPSVPYEEGLIERLANPEYARVYIKQIDKVYAENQSMLGAIGHLRQSLKRAIDALQRFNPHASHPGECHCQICEGEHALSTTSGFASEENI